MRVLTSLLLGLGFCVCASPVFAQTAPALDHLGTLTLETGTRTELFKSRSFRTNFGNDNVTMRVNGKTYRVAASADPVGYELKPGKPPRRLSDAQRPDCSS